MTVHRLTRTRGRRNAALLCLLMGVLCADVTAQPPAPESEEAKLAVKIHLSPGETTLADIVRELSAQTGLKIEAADYLRDRLLTTQLDGLKARETLDTLAELNDWIWRRTKPGHYLVSHRAVRRPVKMFDIPRAMHAALPKDFRIYLQLPDLSTKTPWNGYTGIASEQRYFDAENRAKEELVHALQPDLLRQEAVSYRELTAPRKESLLLALMLYRMHDTNSLLHYDVSSYLIEPQKAVLELEQGNILLVEMYRTPGVRGSRIGFGANIVDR